MFCLNKIYYKSDLIENYFQLSLIYNKFCLINIIIILRENYNVF